MEVLRAGLRGISLSMPCYNIIQWEQRGWVMMDREEEDVGEKGGGGCFVTGGTR